MTGRKALEELAKKRGVVLAASAQAKVPASVPAPDQAARGAGWMSKVMPSAAPVIVQLKEQLGEFWPGVLANLKRGAGYVVDESTRIAIGSPPVDVYVRGKIEQRDGFTVMRVRRREPQGGPSA